MSDQKTLDLKFRHLPTVLLYRYQTECNPSTRLTPDLRLKLREVACLLITLELSNKHGDALDASEYLKNLASNVREHGPSQEWAEHLITWLSKQPEFQPLAGDRKVDRERQAA